MGDAVQASTELRGGLEGAERGIGGVRGCEGLVSSEIVGIRGESEESRLVGARAGVVGDGGVKLVAEGGGFVEAKAVEIVKRRRGRPARAQGKLPPTVKDNDEEDVCFICFDGGSLVLCDRRGCPKAYHPACIKRDEAFFQSAARWNCGWHICSTCQKSSHFMCYTCTFSLCKGCTKGADFLCVRGNKGFCNICLNMVKLIESSEHGNKELVQVDFDDKTSWEYLFKVYWIYLKTKLSLTFDELAKAKTVDMLVSVSRKSRNSDSLYAINQSCPESDYLGEGQAVSNSKRRKTRQWSGFLPKEAPQSEEKVGAQISSSLPNPTEKASKDILEFVSYMKKGDPSSLSPFDAQSLLLQYIKINGLRDPDCQSQIICDSRLRNLFGKARVGHIEMLKLVEYHFQSQEDTPMGRYDTNGVKVDAVIDETNDNQLLGKDMRRGHKKDGNKGSGTNRDGYAAIDIHNINLIYLPLHLMENLLADDEFHEKAVGSVVRIKMSSSDQKQDMYRLVQVVGTIEVAEPYTVRNKLTSWKLEILNISKKEVISVDEISDQEFSEDECKRFRQSIKYGLARRFKVGEILDKAMALRTVKVANFLERESLRLSHLRDRASEKGQNKEFKDYVDKIELLNSPAERQRLQNEILEVHDDPNMDPRHQSEENNGLSFHRKHDDSTVAKHSGMKRKGGNLTYLSGIQSVTKKIDCGANRATELPASSKENRKTFMPMLTENRRSPCIQGITDRPTESNDRKPISNLDSIIQSKATNEMPVTGASSTGAEVLPSAGDFETEKMWHYQDPSWNIQGPFSIVQLRKWNTSGYFPLDLRIWRTGEKQDESILLTDALDGEICKKPGLIYTTCEISIQSNASSEFVRSSCSSSLSTPSEVVVNSREAGQCADSLRSHESLSSYSQLSSSPSTQTLAGKACEALSLLAQERWDGPRCADDHEREADVSVPNLNSEGFPQPACSEQSPRPVELETVQLNPHLAKVDNVGAVGSEMALGSSWTGGSCSVNAAPVMTVEPNGAWISSNPTVAKPNEVVIDLSPTADGGQYGVPSSPFEFWHSIFGEEDEFPFADESVSDLLAEVDAMECLNGPASPTSQAIMRSAEFPQTLKED